MCVGVCARALQGDSGGKANILGGDSISHCEKKVHMNMCIILNGYQDSCLNLQIQNHCRRL
jgi:hypothetical protein